MTVRDPSFLSQGPVSPTTHFYSCLLGFATISLILDLTEVNGQQTDTSTSLIQVALRYNCLHFRKIAC